MGAPTTDNKAAEIVNEVIRALMSGGVLAAETYLNTLAPGILQLPVVGFLLDEGLQYLAQALSVAGQEFATQIVIDIQTNGEASRVVTAGTALQIALASGDQSAIDGAAATLTAAYGDLIHWDGIARPH